jgi:hypothetical protein
MISQTLAGAFKGQEYIFFCSTVKQIFHCFNQMLHYGYHPWEGIVGHLQQFQPSYWYFLSTALSPPHVCVQYCIWK